MSVGQGSYFKGWSSTLQTAGTSGNSNPGSEILIGHVLDVDYDNEPGKVRIRLIGQSNESNDDDIQVYAYPIDQNMVKYPIPGEVVVVITFLRNLVASEQFILDYYYIATVTSNQSITFNSDPYVNQGILAKNADTVFTPEYEHRFEKIFKSLKSFFKSDNTVKTPAQLQPYEGDFVLQGRFGATIRLGSTNQNTNSNPWSKKGGAAGNPIIVMSANRSAADQSIITENVDTNDSSIYICSSQTLDVEMATSQKLRSHLYKYDLVLVNQDAIVTQEDLVKALESEAQLARESSEIDDNSDISTDPDAPKGASGNLSPSELRKTSTGTVLELKAADAWDRLIAAAKADGVTDMGAHGYRPYSVQNEIFDWDRYIRTGGSRTDTRGRPGAERYKHVWDKVNKVYVETNTRAAFPGTSNHGWGRAVDASGTVFLRWLKVRGWQFNWSWYEGRSVNESWHFTYTEKSDLLKSYVTYTDWRV